MRTVIPGPVISLISETLAELNTHAGIDSLLSYAGAPGDPPQGNKVVKTQEWLRRANKDHSVDPMEILGRVLETIMDADPGSAEWNAETRAKARDRLTPTLARCGLQYTRGGHVGAVGLGVPTKSFEDLIRHRSLAAVDEECGRALKAV